MRWFYAKGISLIAASGSPHSPYPPKPGEIRPDRQPDFILSLIADGRLEPKRLITHRFHYSEMVKAYDMADKRDKSMLGVIFNWQD